LFIFDVIVRESKKVVLACQEFKAS
jgi:hypothetical protein